MKSPLRNVVPLDTESLLVQAKIKKEKFHVACNTPEKKKKTTEVGTRLASTFFFTFFSKTPSSEGSFDFFFLANFTNISSKMCEFYNFFPKNEKEG